MKKFMLLTMSVFIFTAGYSQVQIGPRVGISSTKIVIDAGDALEEGDRQFGFHAGLFARFNLGFIYIQPEVLFTSTSGEIRFSDQVNTTEQISELEYNRLDVPVLFGLNLGAFRVNAGPAFRLLLNIDAKEGGVVREVKENYKTATIGYQAGIGFDVGNLLVDLKYEGSLSKFSDSYTVAGETFSTDQRTNKFILSLGFVLFE